MQHSQVLLDMRSAFHRHCWLSQKHTRLRTRYCTLRRKAYPVFTMVMFHTATSATPPDISLPMQMPALVGDWQYLKNATTAATNTSEEGAAGLQYVLQGWQKGARPKNQMQSPPATPAP